MSAIEIVDLLKSNGIHLGLTHNRKRILVSAHDPVVAQTAFGHLITRPDVYAYLRARKQ
jgi:hypothetical protein